MISSTKHKKPLLSGRQKDKTEDGSLSYKSGLCPLSTPWNFSAVPPPAAAEDETKRMHFHPSAECWLQEDKNSCKLAKTDRMKQIKRSVFYVFNLFSKCKLVAFTTDFEGDENLFGTCFRLIGDFNAESYIAGFVCA